MNGNERELKLDKLSHFIDSFSPTELHIFHLGEVTLKYFYMAQIQVRSFTELLAPTIFSHKESLPVYSYTAGTYTLVRTCLEASRKLTDEFIKRTNSKKLEAFRIQNRGKIGSIIDVCNDLIKHPISGSSPFFVKPGGFDTYGQVTFYQYSSVDSKHFKLIKVTPIKDLNIVSNYLEDLAEVYIELVPKGK